MRCSQAKKRRKPQRLNQEAVDAGEVQLQGGAYQAKHPALLCPQGIQEYPGFRILEVAAYYKGEPGQSPTDEGTVLRFVERGGFKPAQVRRLSGIEDKDDVEFLPSFTVHSAARAAAFLRDADTDAAADAAWDIFFLGHFPRGRAR